LQHVDILSVKDRWERWKKQIKAFVMSVSFMRLLRNVASYIQDTRNLVSYSFLFLMYTVQ